MTTICRVLPHESGDGPTNMAFDEALLDSVASDPSTAVMRTYEWSVPTLSLGYFQSIHEVDADPRWAGLPIVRRPTGGGALWHDRELTYAVVVPADHPTARPSRSLYATIHGAIADHLRSLGLEAGRRGESVARAHFENRPFLCFTDRDPDDIVLQGSKIVGSAQRRRSGAVLQHGSILLGRSPTTPDLAGLSDLSGTALEAATWAVMLKVVIPRALGLIPRAEQARPEERRDALRLRELFDNDAIWTRRR